MTEGQLVVNSSPYARLIGAKVAEPSEARQTVPMLQALPQAWSKCYSRELNLLKEPPPEARELASLNCLAQQVTGTKAEYIACFARNEVLPLWGLVVDGRQRACAAFKTVMKKVRVRQRKILACLWANACFKDAPRDRDLEL